MQPVKSFLVVFLLIPCYFSAQRGDSCIGRPEDRFRVLFILDASYSMDRKWGKENLWDISRRTIEEFAFFLQKNYNVEMGLRVYGHQSPASVNDCKDSKLEVPIELNAASKIVSKLRNITFRGTTPLTYSLEKAAEDLGCNSKKNVIILITDGYETCQLNPCAVAEKLQDYRISIKPIIMGVNLDFKDIEHLKCIGDFYNIKSKEQFKKDLYNSFVNIANKKSFSIFLNNNSRDISASNVPFSIFNSSNHELIATYYHHNNSKGIPDTITIGNYDSIDIKIHSIPSIMVLHTPLKKFIHNRIDVNYPIGDLKVSMENVYANPHYDFPEVIVYQKGILINREIIPYEKKLQEGIYDIYISTIPPIYKKSVQILRTKTNTISIPNIGYLTINKSFSLHADIYAIQKEKINRIHTLNINKSKEILSMLPGKYKLIYKSAKALSIHGTYEKNFEIKAMEEFTLNL